jgi:roadblock/LC7 domain-containing protein
MADLATLQARREALAELRSNGILTAETDGRKVTYRSDADMARAIADLDAQIAAASPSTASTVRARYLVFSPE